MKRGRSGPAHVSYQDGLHAFTPPTGVGAEGRERERHLRRLTSAATECVKSRQTAIPADPPRTPHAPRLAD